MAQRGYISCPNNILVEHIQEIIEGKRFCGQAKLGIVEVKHCSYSRTSQRL